MGKISNIKDYTGTSFLDEEYKDDIKVWWPLKNSDK